MRIDYMWQGGKCRALTMSYDDGKPEDRRLVEIFNENGIRGTFHLNSGRMLQKPESHTSAEEIPTLYAGHEVSAHTLNHGFPNRMSAAERMHELLADRENLEKWCGYPVRGMSYPYGEYSAEVMEQFRSLGVHYSRTTRSTGRLVLPEDFMAWHPTCHHKDEKLMTYLERFLKEEHPLRLLYVWGHSYEFSRDDNWGVIEEFCRRAGGNETVWYATNIEIYDYVQALHGLEFSVARDCVRNGSAIDVWLSLDGTPVCCPAGKLTKLF